MPTPTLGSLIADVEAAAPTDAPLDLLATAAATVVTINDVTDSVLSHFVDRCRHAGHSWAEIGAALGVTKQAVQKRFTVDRVEPDGWERFTERARRLVQEHAPAAAEELGHAWVGTEHLLLGFYADPAAVAPRVLVGFGLDRDRVVAAITARTKSNPAGRGPLTPRAWAALASCRREAVSLGHNYIGTEHQLLGLLSGVGGLAAEILDEAGITHDRAREKIVELLIQMIAKGPQP
jgi:ATP-dependent Clp protease ATP-binding subunit ClpA